MLIFHHTLPQSLILSPDLTLTGDGTPKNDSLLLRVPAPNLRGILEFQGQPFQPHVELPNQSSSVFVSGCGDSSKLPEFDAINVLSMLQLPPPPVHERVTLA